MPTLPSWTEALAQITAFLAMPLVAGFLLFMVAIVAGVFLVQKFLGAIGSK